jgi:hypothetical protein
MERLSGRVDTLHEWLLVKAALAKVEDITRAILVLRGRRVLLDAELAVLYGVTTLRLNEQVRRNRILIRR